MRPGQAQGEPSRSRGRPAPSARQGAANVVLLCDVPTGKAGRPSTALTLDQAEAVLTAATGTAMYAYIVLSILIGARTEELRALTWDHVDLDGDPHASPPVPPSIMVWRSVRAGGETKTKKSRRTLALPMRCVEALGIHRELQQSQRQIAGKAWQEHGLVFASSVGTERNANNVLRRLRPGARQSCSRRVKGDVNPILEQADPYVDMAVGRCRGLWARGTVHHALAPVAGCPDAAPGPGGPRRLPAG